MPVKELPIPPNAIRTADADELLRVFINAEKHMDVMLVTGFPDPATWGMVLSDIARHVSRAYTDIGYTEQQALARIKETLMDEWDRPPGAPTATVRTKR